MIKAAPLFAALALLSMASPLTVRAQAKLRDAPSSPTDQTPTLSLAAFGETRIVPDQATITLGVQSLAPTAAEAMERNADQMSRVVSVLHAASLPDRAIQTSSISLDAQYDYQPNVPARLTGYQASNTVTITIDQVTRLGAVLDAVVAAGANQVNGIGFGLKNPGAAEDAARLAAVKALFAKANLYAQATGYRGARLIRLSEGGDDAAAPPRPVFAMARMQAAPTTPVSAGEMTVRIDLSGQFTLTR